MASDGFPYPVNVPGNFSVNDGPTAEQLKPFGYAPGNYEMKCPVCRALAYNVDKRAMRCWQCAANAFRAAETRPVEAPSEPYRTVDERCEILASEMTDSGNHNAARVLYEAESRIRDLQRDYHLMCEEDRRLQAGILEIADTCDRHAKSYSGGRGLVCKGIAMRLRALLPSQTT